MSKPRLAVDHSDLMEVFELYVSAIASVMPPELNDTVAETLQRMAEHHQHKNNNAGVYGKTIADLIRSVQHPG
jgi:hypothetical protein